MTRANSAQRAEAPPLASPGLPISATGLAGLLFFATFKRARRRLLPLLCLVVVLIAFLSSCGGGGSSSRDPAPITSDVASSIVITATGTPASPGSAPIVQRLELPITVVQ